jgi:hypothetical protein
MSESANELYEHEEPKREAAAPPTRREHDVLRAARAFAAAVRERDRSGGAPGAVGAAAAARMVLLQVAVEVDLEDEPWA